MATSIRFVLVLDDEILVSRLHIYSEITWAQWPSSCPASQPGKRVILLGLGSSRA
jgi:hypothetical protein